MPIESLRVSLLALIGAEDLVGDRVPAFTFGAVWSSSAASQKDKDAPYVAPDHLFAVQMGARNALRLEHDKTRIIRGKWVPPELRETEPPVKHGLRMKRAETAGPPNNRPLSHRQPFCRLGSRRSASGQEQ